MNRAKFVAALAGTAIVSFGIGIWTPRWMEIYWHNQDIRNIAKHCNDVADHLDSEDKRTAFFRKCFSENIAALAEVSEITAARRAGDLARKID
ncbi:hypothetical protein [Burkholderia glumae]|uniref:hypothetical protein n=1 Tax=Burkholderia glumae TaxID=337 RepID=UPI002150B572|nr:hypothetical protein [Burkholderia glumae]